VVPDSDPGDPFPGQPWWPKSDLVRAIRDERQRFDEVLARVPRERLAEPGVSHDWSVKDVLAHIAWGLRENVGVARTRVLAGSDLWKLGDDERNAIVFERERARPLDDVLRDHRESFDDFMRALDDLTEEELNDPARIRDMIPGWRPWRILYHPGHADAHAKDICAWLERGRPA
jgi:uncharacterized protein (TIGR03083 family)